MYYQSILNLKPATDLHIQMNSQTDHDITKNSEGNATNIKAYPS